MKKLLRKQTIPSKLSITKEKVICPLCNNPLETTHTAHFAEEQVKEEVFCPQCEITNTVDYHSLQ
ncbi:MAG: hypothetical protein HAW63_03885 [Bdellovibrionaceae bacterium]|nr:hypothetical protein [Pseudobdellovibrionaceae bacterium]